MNMRSDLIRNLGLSGVLCVGIASATFAGDMSPQERVQKQMGSQGSEMGVPEPGTVRDIESTKKKRDPSKAHSPGDSGQITIGGAQYFVEGEVMKIDGENYWVKKDDTDEQVRLIVNRDTNLDCAAAPASAEKKGEAMATERVPLEKQAPEASERQIEQGQRKDETALGTGFRIGQCNFQPGNRVKAEVDDMGRVSTLKYLAGLPASSPRSTGESAGTGELAIPGRQDKPGQLDIAGAGEYTVVPVRRGELKSVGNQALQQPIKNLKGETVGRIENLLLDAKTGRIEYAVIEVEGTYYLKPVPYVAIKLKQQGNNIVPVIDTNKYDLAPGISTKDTKDLSPSVKEIVKQMETLRENPPKAPSGESAREKAVKQGTAGGQMGEEGGGGGGPSGLSGGESVKGHEPVKPKAR